MSTPNAASYLTAPGGTFTVKDAPYSKPGPGEIVIKNAAVAANPMHWGIQAFGAILPFPKQYPVILGADVAGEVYEVGEDVTRFKKGDRVIGKPSWFLNARPQDGGFQHYTVCISSVVSPLPASIPFTSGCVLPLALCTAAMGLYPSTRLALPLPQPTKPKSANKVLIWGGSSSTGSAAIQLAVASGVTVIAAASSTNHGFVKGLGARAVLDYHDDKIIENLVEIIKAARGKFAGALDAIAKEQTWRACAEVVKALGGGKVVSNLPTTFVDVPEGVEVSAVNDTSAAIVQHKEIVEGIWMQFVPEASKAGTLNAVPEPIVVGKGLEKIGEGVELCKKGVSRGKVVVEI